MDNLEKKDKINSQLIKGIIFDMDNTLLCSKINFAAMKSEIFHLLQSHKLLPHDFPVKDHTVSTMMQKVKSSPGFENSN